MGGIELKDKLSLIFTLITLICSLIAVGISVESCTIAKEQTKRYFDQIKFVGERDKNNILTIVQTSGNIYFLESVMLIPVYSTAVGSPFKKGNPYSLDLLGTYMGKEKGYSIPDISKKMCITQVLRHCEALHLIGITMEYDINGEKRIFKIP